MQRYSRIAIFLHWTIAALLAFQISVGSALENLGARGFALFQLHKSIGISILLLTLVRIVVRYGKPRPPSVERGWQGALAKAVHAGLYIFMLGAPMTGWALVSTARVKVPTLIFGVVPLPHLPLPMSAHELAEGGHSLLAWTGILLFLLHVAGALRHHLLLRDGLLWRMMPARSPALLLLLPALILVGFGMGRLILPVALPRAPAVAAVVAAAAAPNAQETAEKTEPAEPAPANVSDAAAAAEGDNAAVARQAAGPPPSWSVQPGGRIGFSVGNEGQTINGSFSRWTAAIVMDPDRPESADIRVEIDLASASVGDSYQDGMLAGDEFFGVAAHARAIFTARGAEKTGASAYRASGTLTLKGVAKPQTIRFTLSGTGKARQVSGSATVARGAFGVGNGESAAGLDPQVAITFGFSARAQ